MQDVEEIRKNIDRIGRDIQDMRDCQLKLRQKVAELLCPVKVGEVHEIKGYSYRGKQGKIEQILPCEIWEDRKYVAGWKAIMRVIKKNGEPGDQVAEVRQDQWR